MLQQLTALRRCLLVVRFGSLDQDETADGKYQKEMFDALENEYPNMITDAILYEWGLRRNQLKKKFLKPIKKKEKKKKEPKKLITFLIIES